MEFILRLVAALVLGVVGMPIGVADFNNPARQYENPVVLRVVVIDGGGEVADVNIGTNGPILYPTIDNGLLTLRRRVKRGDVYRRVGSDDRPSFLRIFGYAVSSRFGSDLNNLARRPAPIANLKDNTGSPVAIHLANVATNSVQDCALGFDKGLGTGFGVNRSAAGIESSGNGGTQSEAPNYTADIAEYPGGVRSAFRSVRSLPLGAQVGGTIILSLIAGLCACIGGVRFMQSRWVASALACGAGLFILTGLTFVAWASS